VLWFVIGVLLYIWGVPTMTVYVVMGVCGIILTFYDHRLVIYIRRLLVELVRMVMLELVALTVLGLALIVSGCGVTVGIIIFVCITFGVAVIRSTYLLDRVLQFFADILAQPRLGVLLLIVFVLMLIWNVTTESICFLMFFLAFLMYRWSSRLPGVLAILTLTACPILLALKLDAAAEQTAVYAYLFLVMTVVLQIIEYWRESRKKVK